MFRNEPVKVPGVLGVGAPAPEAALLVREVVQNSWDAALESREEFPDLAGPPFEVCFAFKSYTNERRSRLVDHLGLQELSERVSAVGDRHALGLTDDDCLLHLDDEEELRLLEVIEQAGGGMYGPWRGNESKLWMALCSIGITTDVTGRGGSYGYGKAGLIRGSQVRLVIAYTCFRERDEDLGVTRRLLGMTYWDGHKIDGTSYGAVYGRMYASRPAPTITTGYMTPGRGRFVHPTEQRTITPAEAARLQGFPNSYRFNPASDRPASRSQLAKWIGDAVAMPLGYAAAASALMPQIATVMAANGERATHDMTLESLHG